MRKIIIDILIVVLAGFPMAVYGTEPAETLPVPEISAQTAIMIEGNSGEVLYQKKCGSKIISGKHYQDHDSPSCD